MRNCALSGDKRLVPTNSDGTHKLLYRITTVNWTCITINTIKGHKLVGGVDKE